MKQYEEIFGSIYRRTSCSNVLTYICEKGDDIAIWEQRMADAGAEKATTHDMIGIWDDAFNETEKLLDADLPNTGYCEHILMPDDEEKFEKLNEEEGYPDLPMDILPDREYVLHDVEVDDELPN
jgi:hypothetical protein